jgi:TonB-linked SusC/RagA family outer membrane protein
MRKLSVFLVLMLFMGVSVMAQRTITGTVTSSEDGSPIPGAAIVVKGTTLGTTTDIDGKYTLTVKDGAEALIVRFVGMVTKEVPLGASNVINVTLDPDMVDIEGVVVTALGITREKKALGYSVQDVKAEELTRTQDHNVVNLLNGKVAGVQITGSSGAVGSSSRIIIRGNSSFGNNQPLFVVDGTPISNTSSTVSQWGGTDFGNAAMDIDPNNIESVSVLKGGSAAALYGSRAANGVILITTKKGSKKKGIGVNISSAVTFDQVAIMPKYQNEYGQGFNGSEYLYNQWLADNPGVDYQTYSEQNSFAFYDGNWGGVNDGIDESWGPRLDIGLNLPQFNSPYTLDADGNPVYTATPWVSSPDNVKNFFETGLTFDNSIEINSTSDRGTVRLGLSNQDIKGAIPNTDLKKNSVNLAGSMNLSKRFKADAVINYVDNKSDNLPGGGYDENNVMQSLGGWFGRQVDMDALRDGYEDLNAFGNPYGWNSSYHNNPYWTVYKNTTSRDRDRMFGNFTLSYKLNDWLGIKTRIGNDYFTETRKHVVADGSIESSNGGSFWQSQRINNEFNADLFLNFDKTFGDIRVDGLLGANYMKRDYQYSLLQANELTVPDLYTISNARGGATTDMFMDEQVMNSVFGSVNISYKNFIYLSGTARNDWSSTLPMDNNSYFYPSVQASFLFNEAFELDPSFISFGQFRANWAQVGKATTPYQLFSTYSASTNPFNGISLYFVDRTLPPADLKNETTTSAELGLNMKFFNNRFGFDVTAYDAVSKDQILAVEIASSTGYNNMLLNAGEIENKGIEVLLDGAIFKSNKGFNWDIQFNWSKNVNTVNELTEGLEKLQIASSWGGMTIEARPDEAYGIMMGKGYARDDQGRIIVNPSSGLPMKTPVPVEIGNISPDWVGGVRNTFSFKGVSLSVLIDGRKGGDIYSVSDWFGAYAGVSEETAANNIREDGVIAGQNVMEDVDFVLAATDVDGNIQYDDEGFPLGSGVENDVRVAAQDYFANYWGNQEASIIDGSFIKLREVSLTYSLPSSVMNKVSFIQKVDLSVIGRNLALLYVDKSNDINIDPETGFGTSNSGMGLEQFQLPTTRSIGFKVNIGF